MPDPAPPPDFAPYWRRNMYVCLFGSFTTVMAMSLLLPFLPLYVEQLGVRGHAAIVTWSGIAYGATFLGAGAMAPVWGRVADLYGRKLILMRASLGMAIAMSLIGVAQDINQLVALRLFAGLLGGYASGAIVLVATQTPRQHSGWALGMLSTGSAAGTLLGPLAGGVLPGLIGVRETFFLAGAIIFVAFLTTVALIREDRRPAEAAGRGARTGAWASVPDKRPVLAMLGTTTLMMLAFMSVEPIITVYVGQLLPAGANVVFTSGLVMAASALGSMLAAPRLGRLADRVGHWRMVVASLAVGGAVLLPQAFVTAAWQLIALRFLMGIALAGLMPSVNATIRHSVPAASAGAILGLNTTAQFLGLVLGPLAGGLIGGHIGMPAVFLATGAILFAGAAVNAWMRRAVT